MSASIEQKPSTTVTKAPAPPKEDAKKGKTENKELKGMDFEAGAAALAPKEDKEKKGESEANEDEVMKPRPGQKCAAYPNRAEKPGAPSDSPPATANRKMPRDPGRQLRPASTRVSS